MLYDEQSAQDPPENNHTTTWMLCQAQDALDPPGSYIHLHIRVFFCLWFFRTCTSVCFSFSFVLAHPCVERDSTHLCAERERENTHVHSEHAAWHVFWIQTLNPTNMHIIMHINMHIDMHINKHINTHIIMHIHIQTYIRLHDNCTQLQVQYHLFVCILYKYFEYNMHTNKWTNKWTSFICMHIVFEIVHAYCICNCIWHTLDMHESTQKKKTSQKNIPKKIAQDLFFGIFFY